MVKPCASRLPGYLNGYFFTNNFNDKQIKECESKAETWSCYLWLSSSPNLSISSPSGVKSFLKIDWQNQSNSLGWIVFFERLLVPFPSPPHIVLHHGQLLVLVPRRLCLIMLTKWSVARILNAPFRTSTIIFLVIWWTCWRSLAITLQQTVNIKCWISSLGWITMDITRRN